MGFRQREGLGVDPLQESIEGVRVILGHGNLIVGRLLESVGCRTAEEGGEAAKQFQVGGEHDALGSYD